MRRGRRFSRDVWDLVVAVVALALSGCGDDPDRLAAEARAALDAGRAAEAAATLDRLARLRPPTPADRLIRAGAARAAGRADDASAEARAVADASAEAAAARLIEGQVEVRRNRLRPAEAALLKALALDPSLVQARRELVYVYGQQFRRGDLARQIEALGEVAPLTFDDVWLWSMAPELLGWIPEENVAAIEPILDADPEDRWTRLALADQYRRAIRYADAERTIAGLADADPEARVVRARLALERGDLDEAERLVADDLPGATAETVSERARLLGRLALARRDGPAAVRHFRAAEAARPGLRETALGLSRALAMAGDAAEADAWNAKAGKLDALGTLLLKAGTPDGRIDPALPRRIAAAYEALDRPGYARAWYRLAIGRDPTDPEAQKALFRLGDAGRTSSP